MNEPKVLTPAEAAPLLGVNAKTVVRLCTDGLLTYFKVGKLYRIRRDWVDAYIAQFLGSNGVSGEPSPASLVSLPTRRFPALRGGRKRGPHSSRAAS